MEKGKYDSDFDELRLRYIVKMLSLYIPFREIYRGSSYCYVWFLKTRQKIL